MASAPANPCGLIAKSVFNDAYELYADNALTNRITINEKGIAWPDDVGKKFKRCANSEQLQWIDPEDEHFIVWMRPSGLSTFRKLWGKIESTDLKQGQTYYFKVVNNYNVDAFKGHKNLVLSTSSIFGGKNSFLAISFIVIGSIHLVIVGYFCFQWKKNKGKFEEPNGKNE